MNAVAGQSPRGRRPSTARQALALIEGRDKIPHDVKRLAVPSSVIA